jgi:hypothetical protein
MAPSVSSETQLTRVERTWRISCHARDHVIGPFIVCIEVMSLSPMTVATVDGSPPTRRGRTQSPRFARKMGRTGALLVPVQRCA